MEACPAPAGAVSVRPYSPSDYRAVLSIWQAGFRELAPHTYAVLTQPMHLFVGGSLAATAWLLGARAVSLAAVAWLGFVYSPLGRKALDAMLWRAILSETRKDMTPETLPATWCRPGRSAFFVAVLRDEDAPRGERVVGCAAVLRRHTCHKEGRRARGEAVEADLEEASAWRVSTDAGARRGGVGAALMAAVEAWARENGCKHLSLLTGNEDSKRFYARLGYERESEPRAMRFVFGTEDASGLSPLQRLQLRALRSRIAAGNLLVKRL
jgi:GNAT superfamily N-acetyltransferase